MQPVRMPAAYHDFCSGQLWLADSRLVAYASSRKGSPRKGPPGGLFPASSHVTSPSTCVLAAVRRTGHYILWCATDRVAVWPCTVGEAAGCRRRGWTVRPRKWICPQVVSCVTRRTRVLSCLGVFGVPAMWVGSRAAATLVHRTARAVWPCDDRCFIHMVRVGDILYSFSAVIRLLLGPGPQRSLPCAVWPSGHSQTPRVTPE